jgi:ribonuclease T
MITQHPNMAKRFRGFFPVVVDVETAGFNSETDALLEIAAVTIRMDEQGILKPHETFHHHILPFANAHLDPEALKFTGIDPYHPFRFAVDENTGLTDIFKNIRHAVKAAKCRRAILVGHNAFFDLGFINAAIRRHAIKRNPFHSFTSIDTASLSALALGQTVLAKAVAAANIEFNQDEAHSAIYDAERTADLFCYIVNQWQALGGWSISKNQPGL